MARGKKTTTTTSKKTAKEEESVDPLPMRPAEKRTRGKESKEAVEPLPISVPKFVYAVKINWPDYRNGGNGTGISLYRSLEGALKAKRDFVDRWVNDDDDSDDEEDSDEEESDDEVNSEEEENDSSPKKRKRGKDKVKEKVKKSKYGENEMYYSKELDHGDFIECNIEEVKFDLSKELICEV
mmetsp:Transcript_1825/g.1890  ORF Transcript_1825/g.1890 Transcript_1825/m.1890 type:complete len:182 (-) Transcript_1825:55-600(-)|eukprot:CAMPEP_0173151806 /NCGR_PEP_ID=MMETSP1105-20130129/11819_1 /TAXON_ID=2985 /ORGANISM="Ochromonas sp., Strain BG-1" /LENGTH=181 /DNA_ID=CAMNT_0014067291 /DNA_START=49 /DNA_END=594 /DNA_ORIENTATION=+